MTPKQLEIMDLIDQCGFVRIAYGATVSGQTPSGAVVNIKRGRNALIALLRDGRVKQETTKLSDVRYVSNSGS